MAQDLIDVDDIVEKFLVKKMYKKSGWPHDTIAACKIICTDKDGKTWVSHQIYRNDENDHAEVKLIKYLRWLGKALEAREIIIKVYMNYSPCYKCARKILKYKGDMEDKIKMTITFANFYNTHVHRGNNRDEARANIEELKELYEYGEHAVKLRLLGRDVKWETFLGMDEFFRFEEGEEDECLDKARSDERKRREVQDEMVWDEIFNDGVGVITSGLDNDILEELRKDMDELSASD
ncbi:uncharacterized protein LOC116291839 [Actinia tenebrosa]|uniref:Uncharacterized protein LOC116291839 n=1 Tax=Actinia tenebrosa TaxID=6105 RepID=A0A6P8HQI8_ACTTE|nr:uncharacterized protein LOC116291839 [Actinia tenebrosa]